MKDQIRLSRNTRRLSDFFWILKIHDVESVDILLGTILTGVSVYWVSLLHEVVEGPMSWEMGVKG